MSTKKFFNFSFAQLNKTAQSEIHKRDRIIRGTHKSSIKMNSHAVKLLFCSHCYRLAKHKLHRHFI